MFATSALAVVSTWALEGAREIPARALPVPDTTSPEMRAHIAKPLDPVWNMHPKSVQEWKSLVQTLAELSQKELPALRDKMKVTYDPGAIAGVKVVSL